MNVVLALLFALLPQLTEKVDVNLVNVDVTVIDRHGKPVTDLTKDDFVVFEDGQQQKITHFARVTPDDAVRQRAIVIMIDTRQPSDKLQQNQAITALESLVSGANDGTTWAVSTLDLGGVKTMLQPTTDLKVVRAALEAIRKGAPPPDQQTITPLFDPNDDFQCETPECVVREYERDFNRRISEFAAAFVAAANYTIRRVRLMPGSKDILFVTDSSPAYDPALLDPVAQGAAASNARFFVLAPGGAGGGSSGYWLAKLTGGLYLGSNRAKDSVRMFNEATTNFYELAYVPGPDDGRYHKIVVHLAKSGHFTILHRDGYLRVPRR